MNPNGQPPQTPGNFPPQQPPPQGGFTPTPTPQPTPSAAPNNFYSPQPAQPVANPYTPQPTAPPAAPGGWGPAPQPGAVGPNGYAIDYLDQIAPPPSGPKLFSGSFLWIVIGLAFVFMIAVSIITLSSGNGSTKVAQNAYLRFDNLSKVTAKYHKYLKNSKLSSTDSNFTIFMTNAERDLVDPMAKNGLALKNIDKTLKASEKTYSDNVASKLEDARLNAVLDRTYAREMAYQAQLILDMYNKMAKSNSKSIKDNANNTIPNLQPIQKAFADFNDTTDAS
jgi:hypothetical protein